MRGRWYATGRRRSPRRKQCRAGVPVVALEPAATAIADQRFYLLPIFDHTETFGADGQPLSLLQVATVDPGAAAPPTAAPPAADAFRTGVVFVFDTTRSMNLYLDRARTAIARSTTAWREKLTDKGRHRPRRLPPSSVAKTPGLEYVSRVFEPLSPATTPAQVMRRCAADRRDRVSSHSFNEDAFAGVMDAVERMDWKPYGARVAIPDHRRRGAAQERSARRHADERGRVRAAALAKGVHLIVLHLKTPAGATTMPRPKPSTTLAADPNPRIGSLYVPVSGSGDVGAFGVRSRPSSAEARRHRARHRRRSGRPGAGHRRRLRRVADQTAASATRCMDFLGARPPPGRRAWSRHGLPTAISAAQTCRASGSACC